jgi:hypothetical protein
MGEFTEKGIDLGEHRLARSTLKGLRADPRTSNPLRVSIQIP